MGGGKGDMSALHAAMRVSIATSAAVLTWSGSAAAAGNGAIAVVRSLQGRDQIELVAPDGHNVHVVTGGTANDVAAAWSPDGSQIAFVSDRLGRRSLFVMAPNGTGVLHAQADLFATLATSSTRPSAH